jgi:DNA-binding LacI/PurR family transcriptional regulator
MSIVQIAKRAGVSTATVSRVLNDRPGVRDEVKSQVRAAVQELNYVVPLTKRGPKPGNIRKPREERAVGTLAVVVVANNQKDLFGMPVIASAFGGIMRSAIQNNFKVLIEEMWDFNKVSPVLSSGEVDGVIAFLHSGLRPGDFRTALESIQQYVPVVWAMGGDAGVTSVDHVIPDDRAIARLAFDHLVEHGCRQLAFITDHPDWAMMRNRGQFFSALAHDAGIDWTVFVASDDRRDGDLFGAHVVVEGNLDLLVDRIVASSPRPDGIFIGSDALTAVVHPMLLRRGIMPGEDIRLVSCDNEEVRLAGLHPRPMSIDIGSAEVGTVAVRRLRTRMENLSEPPVLIKVAPFVPESAPIE